MKTKQHKHWNQHQPKSAHQVSLAIDPQKAVIARVIYRNDQVRFGFAKSRSEKFYFSDNEGPFNIDVGVNMPTFLETFEGRAKVGDEIVLIPSPVPARPGKYRSAAIFGRLNEYDQAILKIADRPIYQVVRSTQRSVSGSSAKVSSGVIFTGTTEQMLAEFGQRDGHRESLVDHLATTFFGKGFSSSHRFMEGHPENSLGQKPCNDPRPFPQSTLYRVVESNGKQEWILQTATALELQFRWPIGAKNDPMKSGVGPSVSVERGEIYRSYHVQATGGVWVETFDPRQAVAAPQREMVKKFLHRVKKEVRGTKKEIVLTSFDQLEGFLIRTPKKAKV